MKSRKDMQGNGLSEVTEEVAPESWQSTETAMQRPSGNADRGTPAVSRADKRLQYVIFSLSQETGSVCWD